MKLEFNVDTNAVIKFTNELEKLNHSAFPNAVRETLSGQSKDVKSRTMPKTSSKFVNRNKTFFSANSRVEYARGFDVKTMQSSVGFFANTSTKNNKAVDELEQQEHGGEIKDRSLIPLSTGRTSKKPEKMVSVKNRLDLLPDKLKNNSHVFNARRNKGKTKKQRFIRTIIAAKKSGLSDVYILGNPYKGGTQTLSRIDFFGSNIKSRKLVIKRTPIYTLKQGRAIDIKATHFMKRASHETTLIADRLYIKEARRQFDRHFSKF